MDPATTPKPAEPDPRDGGLDFVHTDIDDARRVLDEESVSQFDVATVVSSNQWKRLRRATLPSDRALTGRGIEWLLALPPNLHPKHLSHRFPRIANGLAEVWDDAVLCRDAMHRLLDDTRKGRTGFPPEVRKELVALRDWTEVF